MSTFGFLKGGGLMVDIIDISVKPGKHASTPLVKLIYKSLALCNRQE